MRYPGGVSYDNLIAWKRLTHNGKRSRGEMSEAQRAEYDAVGFRQKPALTTTELVEAKRAYEEVTRRSRP